MKIDSCRNGCMLYVKDDESLEKCKFCDAPRWQASKTSKGTRKKVPFASYSYESEIKFFVVDVVLGGRLGSD